MRLFKHEIGVGRSYVTSFVLQTGRTLHFVEKDLYSSLSVTNTSSKQSIFFFSFWKSVSSWTIYGSRMRLSETHGVAEKKKSCIQHPYLSECYAKVRTAVVNNLFMLINSLSSFGNSSVFVSFSFFFFFFSKKLRKKKHADIFFFYFLVL